MCEYILMNLYRDLFFSTEYLFERVRSTLKLLSSFPVPPGNILLQFEI